MRRIPSLLSRQQRGGILNHIVQEFIWRETDSANPVLTQALASETGCHCKSDSRHSTHHPSRNGPCGSITFSQLLTGRPAIPCVQYHPSKGKSLTLEYQMCLSGPNPHMRQVKDTCIIVWWAYAHSCSHEWAAVSQIFLAFRHNQGQQEMFLLKQ